MKQIVLPIIFSCIVSQVLCLKCYEWSDKTQLGETVECPPEANACLKAEAEVYKTKGYARSCGMLEGDAQDGDCIETNTNDFGEAHVCFCTSDLCNQASSIVCNATYISVLLSIILCQILRFMS